MYQLIRFKVYRGGCNFTNHNISQTINLVSSPVLRYLLSSEHGAAGERRRMSMTDLVEKGLSPARLTTNPAMNVGV